jgi:hypothetical protein
MKTVQFFQSFRIFLPRSGQFRMYINIIVAANVGLKDVIPVCLIYFITTETPSMWDGIHVRKCLNSDKKFLTVTTTEPNNKRISQYPVALCSRNALHKSKQTCRTKTVQLWWSWLKMCTLWCGRTPQLLKNGEWNTPSLCNSDHLASEQTLMTRTTRPQLILVSCLQIFVSITWYSSCKNVYNCYKKIP